MALWMNRAGKYGESEPSFLHDKKIYLQWMEIDRDLSAIEDKAKLRKLLSDTYPSAPEGRISVYLGQIWIFVKQMQIGDWVALPSKFKPVIHFGEILGNYQFRGEEGPLTRHSRNVKWFAMDVPRSTLTKEILYSFGIQTICRIEREDEVRKLAKRSWKSESAFPTNANNHDVDSAENGWKPSIDLEASAKDDIAKLIARKYKGHGLAWLVEKILNAQGYTTFRSPEGPDFGIDIMAAPGSLGFGQPRIVVQVKSGESPVDRATVDQLIGTMQNVHAEQGLFVSWGGFKSSVERETARQFFRVRLWDQQTLIDQLLATYEKLDEDIRAELPLKRIWTVASSEEIDEEG